jgi:hypothetical protein
MLKVCQPKIARNFCWPLGTLLNKVASKYDVRVTLQTASVTLN